MSHNTLIRNPVTLWTNGSTITECAAIDAAIASLINGDDGGTWAPTSPIQIQGAGLQVSGPVVVARGGTLTGNTPASFRLNDNDVPQLAPNHVGRSRTVVYPCIGGTTAPSSVAWFPRWSDGAMQSLAPMIDVSDGKGPQPARLMVPIRAHDGATISSVTVNFRIGWPHDTLPSKMPKARIVAATAGGQIVPLTSVAAGGDANGYVSAARPGSASLWTGQQTITVPCDQNNVVSIANYTYYVEIVEEQGLTGYPWSLVVKKPCRLHDIASQLSGLLAFDGVTPSDGDRMLVNFYPQAGIWVAHQGVWTRATDLQSATDFTQGFIVPVMAGNNFAGTYWQAQTTTTSWSAGTQPADAYIWNATTAYPIVGAGGTIHAVPTQSHATGYWYQATTTGTTGGSEPAWPTVIGQTVTDGSVTWTCMGPAATPLSFVPRSLDDVETPVNVGTAMFPKGNAYQAISVAYENITQAGFD